MLMHTKLILVATLNYRILLLMDFPMLTVPNFTLGRRFKSIDKYCIAHLPNPS